MNSVNHNRVVKMIATGQSRLAGLTNDLGGLHRLSHLNGNRIEMTVERKNTESVINYDRVAVESEVIGEDDDSVLSRFYRRIDQGCQIVSEMCLPIDDFVLVLVDSS